MSNYTKQPQKARNNNHKKDVFCQEHLGPSHLDWKSKVFFETTISPRLSATTCSIYTNITHTYATYTNIHQCITTHQRQYIPFLSFIQQNWLPLTLVSPSHCPGFSWLRRKHLRLNSTPYCGETLGAKKGEFPSLRSAASKCHQLNCQDIHGSSIHLVHQV